MGVLFVMQVITEHTDPRSLSARMDAAGTMTDDEMIGMGRQLLEDWAKTGNIEVSAFDPGAIGDRSFGWSFAISGVSAPHGELPSGVTSFFMHVVDFARGDLEGTVIVHSLVVESGDLTVDIARKIGERMG